MSERIGAFGEVMMRLATPDHELLSQATALHYSFSGTGVNFLAALSSYGHATQMITALPDNPLGEAARAHLRKLGIGTKHVRPFGDYLGMYFLETGFGPRPSRVTYGPRFASSFNTAPAGSYDWKRIASELDIVHFCGISLAMDDTVRGHVHALAKEVARTGGTVVFDCNYRPSLWGADGYDKARPHYVRMFERADIVFMNERDALGVLGLSSDESSRSGQLRDVIPQVAARYGTEVIAGTHRRVHEDGLHSLQGFMFRNGRFAFSQERIFPVHDRIGAGDAFSSGIVHGLKSGFSDERTVNFATVAAMLAHTTSGDTPIMTERDVIDCLTESTDDLMR